MGTRVHGRNGIVYLQGAGAEAVLLSQAADWDISIDHDIVDVGVMGDDWAYKLRGVNKWSGSLNGTVDTTSKVPWDSALANTSRKFYLYVDKNVPASYYYGLVWPKLSLKGGIGSAVTFACSIDGDGPIEDMP